MEEREFTKAQLAQELQDIRYRLLELQKENEHLRFMNPDVAKLENILKLAKEYGLQRLNFGSISFDMPYKPEVMPYGNSLAGPRV